MILTQFYLKICQNLNINIGKKTVDGEKKYWY